MEDTKKIKKLLILGERFYPEEFLINDLAPAFVQAGFDVSVLTQNPSYPQDKLYSGFTNKIFQKEIWKGINVCRFYTVLGYKSSLIKKLLNYLSFVFFSTWILLFTGYKYDRIFIYHTGPLTQGFAPALISRLYRKKLSIWTQDIWPDTVFAYGFKKNIFLVTALKIFVRFIYKSCDKVMVSSPGFVDKLTQYVEKEKITYIPQWVVPNTLAKPESIDLPKGFNFTFAGNIGKVQNLENVLKAFSSVSANYPNAYLNLVGDGSNLETLKKQVLRNDIKNVVFYGRKSWDTAMSVLQKSDILVISLENKPIFSLTIPLKFQTYLKAAKPIFAVTKGEVASLVEKNNLGYTAFPENILAIEKVFVKFIKTNKMELNNMSTFCTELLEKSFNREKNIQEIIEVIN